MSWVIECIDSKKFYGSCYGQRGGSSVGTLGGDFGGAHIRLGGVRLLPRCTGNALGTPELPELPTLALQLAFLYSSAQVAKPRRATIE